MQALTPRHSSPRRPLSPAARHPIHLLSLSPPRNTLVPQPTPAEEQTFAPLLCRPKGSAFMSLRHVQDLLKIQAVVRVLIENHTILSQNRSAR